MLIQSPKNSILSVLFSEIKRKPDGVDLENFLRASRPTLSLQLISICELFPDGMCDAYTGNYANFCQDFLFHWIEQTDPPLFRSAHFGRMVVLKAVASSDRDLHDLFRHAQLLGAFESGGLVEAWWNQIANLAQDRILDSDDQDKKELGRRGELLVLEYEKSICEKLPDRPFPELVSFEDNFKGWDITTFRESSDGLSELYLEVKTTSNEELFYLTWREARKAQILGENWRLVVVSKSRMEVRYFPPEAILPLIPYPETEGVSWESCQIKFSLLSNESVCHRFQVTVF